jgi:hypothetical protein
MDCDNADHLIKQLLEAPSTFRREHAESFLYAPYSRKIHRRVYCYTHLAYDLWVHLESDKDVAFFNERPATIPFSFNGKASQFTPAYVSRKRDKSIVVHIISREDETGAEPVSEASDLPPANQHDALRVWAKQNNFTLVIWSAKAIHSNPIRLANVKQLLRYVCSPQRLVPLAILEEVHTILRQVRSSTVDHIVHTLHMHDEDLIMMVVAEMILSESCYSDIERYPFHYSTELSLHHAVA